MRKFLPFALLFFSYGLWAQETVVLENNPTSLQWYQVNSRNFRIIFPKGFEEQAQRMANTFEHIRLAEAKSLGKAPRKISVILQNQSTVSNGFVSVLPRRSEFYTMPSQNYNFQGTNDWLNLLASHEYRHIVQYQHAMRGFNKAFYYLFGSLTLAGMSQVAAPAWFWEGDAVATETAFTHSGRGRIPNFGLVFKTNLLEGREFNYHKQYLRSYKHNIPDHYVLGYHMVSYLRKRTNDPMIWGKITGRSWDVPFLPFAFSNAIKKETGLYVTDLYREMVIDIKKQWKTQLDSLTITPFERVTKRDSKAYTDYQFPQPQPDGSVIVLKNGIGDIDCFEKITGQSAEKAFTPGFMNDAGMLSANANRIVWTEYGFDPRWLVRSYSLIKMKALGKGNTKVIGGRRSRYGSAAISPDGSRIVAIRTGTDYKTQLVILQVEKNKIEQELPNPENTFYSMPRWSDDGKRIVVLKTKNEGRTISIVDVASGKETDAIPYSQENMGHPIMYQHYVLFNSPVSGIDNIYAIDVEHNQRYQITSSKYGAYNPAVSSDGKTIYYNDQTRDGLDVVKIPFDVSSWKISKIPPAAKQLHEHLVEQEGRPGLLDTVPQEKFSVSRYRKLKGIINPYAWGLYVDNSLTEANIGISSRDILSTTSINLGYLYDISERTSAWRAAVSYQGIYPIIDLQASLSNRSVSEGATQFYDTITDPVSVVTRDLRFKWREKNIQAGIKIPFMTTSSRFSGNVTIGNYFGVSTIEEFKNNIDEGGRIVRITDSTAYFFRDYADNGTLAYNYFSFNAYRLLKRSRRDINSKWGQSVTMDFFNTPYGGDFTGRLFAFTGLAYFPGLFKHHSLWGYWAYQGTQFENSRENYVFRNQVPVPRGHSISRFQHFYSMSVNYALPLWYPDVSIGPLINFQRVRANVFFDYGSGASKLFGVARDYISTGAELKLDLNIFRFLPQLDIGVRFSKGITPSTTEFEVLLGTFNF